MDGPNIIVAMMMIKIVCCLHKTVKFYKILKNMFNRWHRLEMMGGIELRLKTYNQHDADDYDYVGGDEDMTIVLKMKMMVLL